MPSETPEERGILRASIYYLCLFAGENASEAADREQARPNDSLEAKLSAAVSDWKAKQKQKPKPPVDTAKDLSGRGPLSEQRRVPEGGTKSQDWQLVPVRVAQPPPLSSLRCGLPSPKYPSDHISLVVDFRMFEQ